MDLMNTGFDPYEKLLEVITTCEQLHSQAHHIIEVVNNQGDLIRRQAFIIEQMDRRIKKLEMELI